MYGTRARIGYTSPLLVSEIFPYEFYQLVPSGVTLALTTLDVWGRGTGTKLQDSYDRALRAGEAMAEAGVDLIILGGVPVLASKGTENIDSVTAAMEEAGGVPVTTVSHAYRDAARQLGAKKIVIAEAPHTHGDDVLERAGLTVLGRKGYAGGRNVESTRQSSDEIAQLGRELVRAHPDADTLWINWPHRATVDQIEHLERELGVSVLSATQAIVWEALRLCGIDDSIPGFGRLMREPRRQ